MPCLNQTIEVNVGETIFVHPGDLHSTTTAFASSVGSIVAGRNGASAEEVAVSPSEIEIVASNTVGMTEFSIRMEDGTICRLTIEVVLADAINDPVIDQCSGGKVDLQRGVPLMLSVTNSITPVSILWSSTDPELTFSQPEQPSTTVTASATGTFIINVDCEFSL